MKNLFLFLILSAFAFGQTVSYSDRFITVDFGTMANSVDETAYVSLKGWSKIDSVSATFVGTGELDVDSVTVYRAVSIESGQWVDVSVLGNFTVTLDLAAASKDIEPLFSSNATLITGAALRGVNALKFLTRGATAGNDATDPNKGVLLLQIWGTK